MGPDAAGLTQIEEVFKNILSTITAIGFVALLIMLVTAGISYLMSAGEPKAVQAAHQTVTWALLGIVFMVVAWLILILIADFTGIEALKIFNIKTLCIPGIKGC